jgi:hypothetical protein
VVRTSVWPQQALRSCLFPGGSLRAESSFLYALFRRCGHFGRTVGFCMLGCAYPEATVFSAQSDSKRVEGVRYSYGSCDVDDGINRIGARAEPSASTLSRLSVKVWDRHACDYASGYLALVEGPGENRELRDSAPVIAAPGEYLVQVFLGRVGCTIEFDVHERSDVEIVVVGRPGTLFHCSRGAAGAECRRHARRDCPSPDL